MAGSDLNSVAYVVKKLYSNKAPENLAARDRVFLSMVRKEGGFYGSNLTVAIQYGNQQGVSPTFSTAQANAASTKGVAVTLTRAKQYGVSTIDAEFIQATKADQGAFVRGLKNEIDSMIDEMGHRLAMDLYSDGNSSIGQYSSTVSGTQIALVQVDDAKHFSVGMKVIASANANGSSPRNSGTPQTVTAVDEDNGFVTFDALWTGVTANDFLFVQGAAAAGITGLAGWLPISAPTPSENFFGIDRSVDAGRLSGWKVNSTANTIEENALTLATKIARAGGRPDCLFLSPQNWTNLAKALGSKVLRDQGGEAVAGFEYVSFATPAGRVKAYSDPECPANRGYMVQLNTWTLKYLGDAIPHIVMDDGLESLRQSAADGVEVRGRYWGQLYTTAPGKNGVMAI